MAEFTITIADDKLAGVTAALAAFNDGKDAKDQLPDEAAYLQMVMTSAAESYAVQHAARLAEKVRVLAPKNAAPLQAAIEAAWVADKAEKEAAAVDPKGIVAEPVAEPLVG